MDGSEVRDPRACGVVVSRRSAALTPGIGGGLKRLPRARGMCWVEPWELTRDKEGMGGTCDCGIDHSDELNGAGA